MCGIVGYTGKKQAAQFLLDGLATLEYRGYDSAGVEVLSPDGELHGVKCAGRVSILADRCKTANLTGTTGIAHTRWATHGAPTRCMQTPVEEKVEKKPRASRKASGDDGMLSLL